MEKHTSGIEHEMPCFTGFEFPQYAYQASEPIFKLTSKNSNIHGFNLTADGENIKQQVPHGYWEIITDRPYTNESQFSFSTVLDFIDWCNSKGSEHFSDYTENEYSKMCTLPPISFKTEYKDTIIEYVYPLLYPNRRLLMCYPRNDLSHFKIDELFTGLSHMTFGTDQIERLYKTLVCEQYLNIQYKDIKNKKDHRHTVLYTTKEHTNQINGASLAPYSKASSKLFFELLPKEFNSIRNKLYDVSEFLKYYFIFALKGNPKPIGNVITYKNTFPMFMSRVSFKYMFDDIFYSIDIKNNSIMVYTVFLKKYLQICIKDLDSSSYLFTKPYTEGHIGIPFIEYMKNNILKTTTSSYLTFNNIISSIFLKNKRIEASHYRAIPTNDGILSQGEFFKYLTEDNNFNIIKSNIVGNYCKAIEEGLSKQNDIIININYIEQAQKTISNLSLSDWFSPVPMCPPSDSMGYFSTHYDRSEPLIEVRGLDGFHESNSIEDFTRDVKHFITLNSSQWSTDLAADYNLILDSAR